MCVAASEATPQGEFHVLPWSAVSSSRQPQTQSQLLLPLGARTPTAKGPPTLVCKNRAPQFFLSDFRAEVPGGRLENGFTGRGGGVVGWGFPPLQLREERAQVWS